MRRPTAAYKNLGEFVEALDRAGEIKRIRRPVSTHLEISRLTDAESKSPQGGKALYFESVTGSPFPAATNLFGSPRRIGMALGVTHLDQLAERVRALMEIDPPGSFRDMLGLLPTALSVTRFFPRQPGRIRWGAYPITGSTKLVMNRIPKIRTTIAN